MIYIERLKLFIMLDKIVYVLETQGTVDSPAYRVDGVTKEYYKLKTINDCVFNLTISEGQMVINALKNKYNG